MGGSHTIYPGYFSTPRPSILSWFTRLLTQLPPSSRLSRPTTPACSPHLLRPQQGFSAFRSLLNGCSQTENIASLSLVCSVKEVCPYLAHCEHFREEAVEPSDPDSLKPRHGAGCESWLQPGSSFPPAGRQQRASILRDTWLLASLSPACYRHSGSRPKAASSVCISLLSQINKYSETF